jgi:branched-chain amino acid transport system ATP-binding protein
MSTETLLDIQGLETAYGNSQVLFGLDMQLQAGTTSTLLGRNGMGKTTTVRSILGLTPARSGSIRFRGERIEGLSPDRIARMGVALVPEGRQIFPNLTVQENLIVPSPGRWSGFTISSRCWSNARATWATSSPAASSRCWPLAAR